VVRHEESVPIEQVYDGNSGLDSVSQCDHRKIKRRT
jgi:hypothetical protein